MAERFEIESRSTGLRAPSHQRDVADGDVGEARCTPRIRAPWAGSEMTTGD